MILRPDKDTTGKKCFGHHRGKDTTPLLPLPGTVVHFFFIGKVIKTSSREKLSLYRFIINNNISVGTQSSHTSGVQLPQTDRHGVVSSTSAARLSLHNSKRGLSWIEVRLTITLTNFSSINLVSIFLIDKMRAKDKTYI
jgi:hypothetical protein